MSSMFELVFKNTGNVLWKVAGCTTKLNYAEQILWPMFLKCLDVLEQGKVTENKTGVFP